MLIGGQKVELTDPDALVAALHKLPSGFQERTAEPRYSFSVTTKEQLDTYQRALSARDSWETERDDVKLRTAIAELENVADTLREDGNMLAYAGLMDLSMSMRNEIRHYRQFMQRSSEMEEISEQNNYGRFLAGISHAQHRALFEEHKKSPDQTELLEQMHAIRLRAIDRMFRPTGEPRDEEAIRVEQGEIGLSADKKIGTDNIWECVCVIIRDPITKKTALAHIDMANDANSLQLAMDRLPNHGSPPLQAKIVGASYGDNQTNETGKFRSKANIQKVIHFLEDKDVNILSADIMDINQPRCLVVDPETFTLEEASPRENPNMILANAMLQFTQLGRPLNLAFDLTTSEKYAPIAVTRSNVSEIRKNILGRSVLEIAEKTYSTIPANVYNSTLDIECDLQLGRAYADAYGQIERAFIERASELRSQGYKITNERNERFMDALQNCPLHIGENAEIANKPLINWIQKEAFTQIGGLASANIKGIKQFEFRDTPYTIIENLGKHKSFQSLISQRTSGIDGVQVYGRQ